MLIHRADHDVQHTVAVEVGEHGPTGDAAIDDVGSAPIRGPRELGIGRDREAGESVPLAVPRVDLALEVGDQDLRMTGPVDVADGHAADDGPVHSANPAFLVGARLEVVVRRLRIQARDEIGVHGPSGKHRAVAADRRHHAVGSGNHDLGRAVPIQIHERR